MPFDGPVSLPKSISTILVLIFHESWVNMFPITYGTNVPEVLEAH